MGGTYGKSTRAQTIADDVRTKAAVTLEKKLVLITGASAGIGVETARALATLHPEHLVLAVRNQTKGDSVATCIKKTTKYDNVHVMLVDLASLESVRNFCAEFEAKFPDRSLDILINNAGIMALPEYEETVDKIEAQFAANHLSHFLLTNLLMNKIKKSDHAKIINVSSAAHNYCPDDLDWKRMPPRAEDYSPWKNHGISKMSNIWFSRELQRRFDDEEKGKHQTFSLHPGVIATDLFQHTSYYSVFKLFGPLVAKDTQQGAATSVYCAVHPEAEKSPGCFFKDCAVAEDQCKAIGKDMDCAKKLWDLSEKLTGLKQG